jgi:PAS domain S-box-containing protein
MTKRLRKNLDKKTQATYVGEKSKSSITIEIADFLKFNGDYKFLESVINFIPEPISLKNKQGEYLAINQSMEELFGFNRGQVIGKTIHHFKQKVFASRMHQADIDVLTTGFSTSFEIEYEKQDGTHLNLVITKHKINLSNNTEFGILTLAKDISKTKRAEEILSIQHMIDYIESLKKGFKETVDHILEHIFLVYWVDAAGVYILNTTDQRLDLISHTGLSENFIENVKCFDKNSNQLKILLERKSIFIRACDLPESSKKLYEEEGLLFTVVIPLINYETDELIGNLNLASRKFEFISEEDWRVIETIARRLVNLLLYAKSQEKLKVANILLEKRVEERTRELNKKVEELTIKEKEIRESEEKIRRLQENLPVGIFSTNPEGRLIYVNPAGVKLFGYESAEQMQKVSVMDLYYSKDKRSKLLKILINKGHLSGTEVQLIRKNNEVFWGLLNVQTVFDDEGNPLQFDGVIEDITEIKIAKKKLVETNIKISSINEELENKVKEAHLRHEEQNNLLIQKSKLESLGELAAGIAHEINQPLGVMSLTLENLKFKLATNKITPEYLDVKFQSFNDNLKRIRGIIDHIRSFSHEQDSFVLDKVNLNKIVLRALSMIGTQYENHNIHIRTELKENMGFTVGSNMKTEQVILNLISNARYALEEKGCYENETEFKKEILIKTDATHDKVILIVEDNGTGIKFNNLAKIFDPFYTSKPEGFGTGLGLSIVWGIVKSMRGDIIVNSKENKYTKFKITFPRFPEKD